MATKRQAKRLRDGLVIRSPYIHPGSPKMKGGRVVRVFQVISSVPQEDAEIKEYLSELPTASHWLRKNSFAQASVERGLQQAAAGEVHDLGSFAKFADLEIDD